MIPTPKSLSQYHMFLASPGDVAMERQCVRKYFAKDDRDATETLTKACQGIYRALANAGTWGLSALSRMVTSGLDFENMPDEQKRVINNLPAMLYHGVNSEAAVLMRTNAVPHNIAAGLGETFAAAHSESDLHSVRSARSYLRTLSPADWQRAVPPHARMSGEDYREHLDFAGGRAELRNEVKHDRRIQTRCFPLLQHAGRSGSTEDGKTVTQRSAT